jgi:hypothetical protein
VTGLEIDGYAVEVIDLRFIRETSHGSVSEIHFGVGPGLHLNVKLQQVVSITYRANGKARTGSFRLTQWLLEPDGSSFTFVRAD